MAIDQEVGRTILAKIRSKTPDFSCPVCLGVGNWAMLEIGAMSILDGPKIDPVRVIPVAPITCKNCGYTMLFNIAVLGVEPPK